jgi:hypothetical protein
LPIRESFVKTPEIGPGRADVPSGILTGPREKLREKLCDADGADRGAVSSTDNVRSPMAFLIELAAEEVFGNSIFGFRCVDYRNPFGSFALSLPRAAHLIWNT